MFWVYLSFPSQGKLEDGAAILTAGYIVRSAFLDVLLPLQLTSHIHPLWVYLSFPLQGKLEDGAAILTAGYIVRSAFLEVLLPL